MKPSGPPSLLLLMLLAGTAVGYFLATAGERSHLPIDVEWPTRGNGEALIEYLDPDCPFSLRVHADIDRLFEASQHKFRHVMIPVSISSTQVTHTPSWAEALCATPRSDVWALAGRLTHDMELHRRIPKREIPSECHNLVRDATEHMTRHSGERNVPMVEYRGRFYRGYDRIRALLSSVGEIP